MDLSGVQYQGDTVHRWLVQQAGGIIACVIAADVRLLYASLKLEAQIFLVFGVKEDLGPEGKWGCMNYMEEIGGIGKKHNCISKLHLNKVSSGLVADPSNALQSPP